MPSRSGAGPARTWKPLLARLLHRFPTAGRRAARRPAAGAALPSATAALCLFAATAGAAFATPSEEILRAAREAFAHGDHARAFELVRPLAQSRDPRGEFFLGYSYLHGHGVEADATRAAEWFLRAATRGHPPAQYALGLLFAAGEGVERDLEAARRWLETAQANGHEFAQGALRNLERLGPGRRRRSRSSSALPSHAPSPRRGPCIRCRIPTTRFRRVQSGPAGRKLEGGRTDAGAARVVPAGRQGVIASCPYGPHRRAVPRNGRIE